MANNSGSFLVVSENNPVSNIVLHNFLGRGFKVTVLTFSPKAFYSLMQDYNNLNVIDQSDDKTINKLNFDYAIFISGHDFSNASEDKLLIDRDSKQIDYCLSLDASETKLVCIFLYSEASIYNYFSSKLSEYERENNISTGKLFVNEIISRDRFLLKKGALWKLVVDLKDKINNLSIANGFFAPVSQGFFEKELLKYLFSLNSFQTSSAIVGKPLSKAELNYFLPASKSNPEVSLSIDNKEYPSVDKKIIDQDFDENKCSDYFEMLNSEEKISYEKKSLDQNRKTAISKGNRVSDRDVTQKKNIFANIYAIKNLLTKTKRIIPTKIFVNKSKKRKPKGGLLFIKIFTFAVIVVVLIIPLSFVVCSYTTSLLAQKEFVSGRLKQSKMYIKKSESFSRLGKEYAFFLHGLTKLDLYSGFGETLSLVSEKNDVIVSFAESMENTLSLWNIIGGREDGDYKSEVENLYLSLDKLYQKIQFLKGDIKNTSGFTKEIINLSLNQMDLDAFGNNLLLIQKVIKNNVFSAEHSTQKSFLLLFLNSNFLRSTGGKIFAYVELTLKDGKITFSNPETTAKADQQLKGITTPPSELSKYFEISNWYLRDSNWDPDFSESAKQSEWFIDREVDQKNDGVVSINSNFLLNSLSILNNQSTDINGVMTSINKQSDVINYPAEGEDYITDFLNKYLDKVVNIKSDEDRFKFIRLVINSLGDKDLELFFNNTSLQNNVSELNWGNTIKKNTCSDNCISDYFGIVEDSVQKGSLNVEREVVLDTYLEQNLIKHKATVFFNNNNNHDYSFYLRFLVNAKSGFSPSQVIQNETKENVELDVKGLREIKTGGIFIKIPGKTANAISVSWEEGSNYSYDKNGKYELYLFKQPGIKSVPYTINTNLPLNTKIKSNKPLSLTGDKGVSYNTNLTEDDLVRLDWKNE